MGVNAFETQLPCHPQELGFGLNPVFIAPTIFDKHTSLNYGNEAVTSLTQGITSSNALSPSSHGTPCGLMLAKS